jgi:AcrR family transcriptional regulator
MEPIPQATPRAARPGGRTARTRGQVLDAVASLLLEGGFDALTVDAVAARSGVHRTTVYRRWRDTGALLADSFDAAREQSWQPPDTGSLLGDLTEINRQIVAALTVEPSITLALITASFRSPAAARALRDFWEDRLATAAVVVERAAARTEAPLGNATTSENNQTTAHGEAAAHAEAAASENNQTAAAGSSGGTSGAEQIARGGRGGVDARTVLVAACAPIFYELALMRSPAGDDIAERYARVGVAAAG